MSEKILHEWNHFSSLQVMGSFSPEKNSIKLATKFKAMASVILVRRHTKFAMKVTSKSDLMWQSQTLS